MFINRLKYGVVLLTFIFLTDPLHSQVKHSHTIVLGFLQIKDQLNQGKVFTGVQLEYRYGLHWKIQDNEILYQPRIALGIGFNQGMTGHQLKITPVNVTWTIPFYEQYGHTLKTGLNLVSDYSYQIYPFLHSAHLFWMSEIGLAPVLHYHYQWETRRIGLLMQNSLLGFTSHTQKFDPYFFHLGAKTIFFEPHKTMKFGSIINYFHTIFSLEYTPNISEPHSFLYELDYFNSFYGMHFERLNHNTLWKISL